MSLIIHGVGSVLLVICAVMSVGFCLVYHFTDPWIWAKSPEGRFFMASAMSPAAILTMYSIKIISRTDAVWFEFLRLIVFATFPIVLGWQLWMLWRLRIRPKLEARRHE